MSNHNKIRPVDKNNPNGTTYEGGFKNDVFHGQGKFIDTMGKVIEGTFKEGKLIK